MKLCVNIVFLKFFITNEKNKKTSCALFIELGYAKNKHGRNMIAMNNAQNIGNGTEKILKSFLIPIYQLFKYL